MALPSVSDAKTVGPFRNNDYHTGHAAWDPRYVCPYKYDLVPKDGDDIVIDGDTPLDGEGWFRLKMDGVYTTDHTERKETSSKYFDIEAGKDDDGKYYLSQDTMCQDGFSYKITGGAERDVPDIRMCKKATGEGSSIISGTTFNFSTECVSPIPLETTPAGNFRKLEKYPYWPEDEIDEVIAAMNSDDEVNKNKPIIRICRRYASEQCAYLQEDDVAWLYGFRYVTEQVGFKLCVFEEMWAFGMEDETGSVLTGALVGGAVGGPPGAIGGAVVGAMGGARAGSSDPIYGEGCIDLPPPPPGKMCDASVPLARDGSVLTLSDLEDGETDPAIHGWNNDACYSGSCFLARSCYASDYEDVLKAKYDHPITSRAAQCIKETLTNLFVDSSRGCANGTVFSRIQNAFRDIVVTALTLYIIFWGVRIAIGQQVPGPGEAFMAMLKFSLVIYFVIDDAWEIYFEDILEISMELALIMLQGGNTINSCVFDPATYAPADATPEGYVQRYEWMALWDTLDCKLMTYLGFDLTSWSMNDIHGSEYSAIQQSGESGTPAALKIGSALFFAWGFVPWILSILFFVLFLMFTITAVQSWVISILALTILIFLSPVFIPMSLFSQTKKFFEEWLSELISFVVYPVILFAFLGLTLATFDSFFFGNSVIVRQDDQHIGRMVRQTHDGQGNIIDESNCDTSAIACIWANIILKEETLPYGTSAMSYDATRSETSVDEIIPPLLKICLFAFLFYHFTAILSTLAAEVSGSFRTNPGSLAMSAKQAFGKLKKTGKQVAKKAADAKSGGQASKAQRAADEANKVDQSGSGTAGGGNSGPATNADSSPSAGMPR